MKSHPYFLSVVLASGLALGHSVHAQGVTGTPYLSNVDPTFPSPSALYSSWATATITNTATGLRVQSSGYGSGYYVIPAGQVQTISTSATIAQLVFTVGGNAADYNYVGTPFTLNDDHGSYNYGGYSGSGNPGNPATVVWSGNTATWTVPLLAAQLANVQAGSDHIYSFNHNFDPATLINGRTSYDVTFNSLTVRGVVPEPSCLALCGLGIAVACAMRHRKKSSFEAM